VDGRQSGTDGRTEGRSRRWWGTCRTYAQALGPGLVTGASDDDPSGIATYSQAGAQFGLGLVWTALLTLPLMATVQEICDRSALATGKSLGSLCRLRFKTKGRTVIGGLVIGLIIANTLNITADLLAVGAGMNLLHLGPVWLWALIAGAAITTLMLSGSFIVIQRVFKLLCLALLSYVVVLVVADVDWRSVIVHTLVPHIQLTSAYLALLVAVLGTTISPYLFFWQTAHRVEELREEDLGGDDPVALKNRTRAKARTTQREARFDVFSGMALSNIVMFAIIVATASTIGAHGSKTIEGAAQAAEALKPVAGSLASALFALGFIGSGMLAVPVLAASGSVALAGLLDRDWGFAKGLAQAPLFYALVAVGTAGGTVLSLVHVNPIKLLVVSAVINGLAAGPFLIIVMLISDDHKIMGAQRNGRTARTIGWATTALMIVAGLALIYTTIAGS
jgi:NRAMP (natural resistance-associated macrophage protein)-like metal ion transporter